MRKGLGWRGGGGLGATGVATGVEPDVAPDVATGFGTAGAAVEFGAAAGGLAAGGRGETLGGVEAPLVGAGASAGSGRAPDFAGIGVGLEAGFKSESIGANLPVFGGVGRATPGDSQGTTQARHARIRRTTGEYSRVSGITFIFPA